MRILITGGAGQLGRELQRAFAGHDLLPMSRADLDVIDEAAVDSAMDALRPDLVLHTAALTDTARCEREPDAAMVVNARGAENIAKAAERTGAVLVALSTNEVFDGAKRAPYLETDDNGAINAYGASKLEGERLVAEAYPDALIVRVAWLYGDGDANFVAKVLAAARGGRELNMVTDEIASPTAARDVADAIAELVEADAPGGVYHITNTGEASRYDWARAILDLGGLRGVAIAPVTTDDLRAYGYDGPRKPAYSVLANTRAAALGITLPRWQDALAAHLARARVAADG